MPPLSLIFVLRVIAFVAGVTLIFVTLESTIETLIVPRAIRNKLIRNYYMALNRFFRLRLRYAKDNSYATRDRIMAVYAPLALVILPFMWLSLIMIGYSWIFWGVGFGSMWDSFVVSGSSLLTLGTVVFPDNNHFITVLMFSEAMMGMVLVALIIAYLPSMYSAFSMREQHVTKLETPAGTPPSPLTMLLRLHRITHEDDIDSAFTEVWKDWRDWFAAINESHTSLAALVFFRSPKPDHSWVTAAGVILDTASLYLSTIDKPFNPYAALCIRAGYVALQDIARFFDIRFDPKPPPNAYISISRYEFDEVYNQLKAEGLPVKADQDQAWQDFRGWRVNYDTVLLRLAALTMAPYAMWVSDRSMPNLPPRYTHLNEMTTQEQDAVHAEEVEQKRDGSESPR